MSDAPRIIPSKLQAKLPEWLQESQGVRLDLMLGRDHEPDPDELDMGDMIDCNHRIAGMALRMAEMVDILIAYIEQEHADA